MKTKSALSYFGSDSEVARQLASRLDGCSHVTIPFVGGGSIIPHLAARGIVANDLHDLAVNFYRVLSGAHGSYNTWKLIEHCKKTLSHPGELKLAEAVIVDIDDEYFDMTQAAWAYWAICWLGRKGKGGTKHVGGKPSVRWTAQGGNNASRITAAADDLEEWAAHLKRCEWTQPDFLECLSKVNDKPECGIYCDPPWISSGRNYVHSFTEEQHVALSDKLREFEHAAIVVRYGDDPMIRNLYSDWNIEHAKSRTQANKDLGEIWITRRTEVQL